MSAGDVVTPIRQGLGFQLSYGDCDAVGIAYFAIFYPWMERSYSTWLYAHGIRSGQMSEQLGVYTVGLESRCRYVGMCRVFDVLNTQLVLRHLGTTSFVVACEFRRDGELVAVGEISFACRSLDHQKTPMPPALLAALNSLPQARD